MVDIATATAAFSTAAALISNVTSLIRNVSDVSVRDELNKQIIDLNSKLLELMPNMLALINENEGLRKQLADRSNAEELKKSCRIRNGAYQDPANHNLWYCGGCLNAKNQTIPLSRLTGNQGKCPVWEAVYTGVSFG